MPVVLSYGGATESGLTYDDKFGDYYTYPARYRNIIKSGKSAIFYRGRRDLTGGYSFARYVGYGVIGAISDAPSEDGRTLLRCETRSVTVFDSPIAIKRPGGLYYENSANSHKKPPLWFSRGVRSITEEEYQSIVNSGLGITKG